MDGNWRAACCARTHKEFTSNLGTVVEEADEAEELLNVIHDSKLSKAPELARLRIESTQLRKIFSEGIDHGLTRTNGWPRNAKG